MLNNQDFTQERQKYLGGSDIGAILGVSKYRTGVDVWLEKTGKSTPPQDSIPLRFGQYAEEFVAQEYSRATQEILMPYPNAFVHSQYTFMHGHIDRFVTSSNFLFDAAGALQAKKILECKTANPFGIHEWGESGTDQVPLSYLAQCTWYMMITNIDQADLAVLFGNTEFRIYKIQRDKELEEIILQKAVMFWEKYVLKDIPPPAQQESDYKHLFAKGVSGKSIEAKEGTIELIHKLSILNSQIKQCETKVSEIKQNLMGQMGESEILTYQGQTLATWKAPKPSLRLDTKRLTEAHPDLIKEYQVISENSRRLMIKELA